MSKTPRVVRTPGEDPAAQPAAEADQAAGTEDAGAAAQGKDEEFRYVPPDADDAPALTQALHDEIAQLRAERDALATQAKGLLDDKAAREAADAAKQAATDLQLADRLTSNRPVAGLQPEQVTPSQIRRPVLTEKGWIAPTAAPRHPAER